MRGLRGAGGSTLRLRSFLAAGNAASRPRTTDPPLAAIGRVPPTGGMRTYRVCYRNAATFCPAATWYPSNGLILHGVP